MSFENIIDQLDPHMVDALRKQSELMEGEPTPDPEDLKEVRRLYLKDRAFWNEGGPVMAATEERTIETEGGDVRVRIHRPHIDKALPALVYLHGGGWIVGNIDTHDRIMRMLASHGDVTVIGVDYTLSPEGRFPKAHLQCLGVARAVCQRPEEFNVIPGSVALGGDSAGGNMSLSAAMALRDEGVEGIRTALLYYGSYGLRDSRSRRLYGAPEYGLPVTDLNFFRRCLMENPDDLYDPRFDMLTRPLEGLPHLFIAPCALDPLFDDSLALKQSLDRIGADYDWKIYDGVLHGFLHMSRMVDKAAEALLDGAHILKRHLPR